MKKKANKKTNKFSRRDFIKTSATVGMGTLISGTERVFAQGSDRIRVGLIGCGSRGTGAAVNCVESSDGVQIVAMADLFQDRLDKSLNKLKVGTERMKKLLADNLKVTADTCFVGFDAYKKVLACDVDMVILATPPHFRPEQLKAAIQAGKHVFMEKPVAVDPVGVRSIIASSELAEQKGLAIVAGTQRRHQQHYLEIMKRIHNGAIGDIVAAQCYWNQESMGGGNVKKNIAKAKEQGWSDMELQIRNWQFYTWLAGDHIVEQHMHNIDVVNWAIGSHPVKAMGMGGREVLTGSEYGNIYDHFAVEFEYPNNVRVLSMCRQMDGTSIRISEHIVGTKGTVYADHTTGYIKGQNPFEYDGESPNPYVREHADLIAGIRAGKPLNEGRRVAESTLTAIMGRMSAYTGRELKWDWVMNASKLDLTPSRYRMGHEPVAVPGKTKLI